MKIGFMVNDIATEEPGYTTTRLAMAAINRGHEAWVIGAGDFAYDADETVRARATSAPQDDVQVLRDLPHRPQGTKGQAGTHHRRRSGRADAAQRSIDGPGASSLGAVVGHHLRPRRHAHRRHRAQRPQRPGQGHEQDVLPVLPRGGPPANAHHARPRRDQGLLEGGGRSASCSSRCRARAAQGVFLVRQG